MKSRSARSGTKPPPAIVAAAAMLLMAACGGDREAVTAAAQTDSGGAITVWVDPPRVPAAEAFQEAYPDIEVTSSRSTAPSAGRRSSSVRQLRLGRVKDGRTRSSSRRTTTSPGRPTPRATTPPTSPTCCPTSSRATTRRVLSFCDIDGKIRCLRNDAAPDVFWYNKAFFDENGYTLPTTWEEYGDLAVTIAAEHPGKISGFLGDAYAVEPLPAGPRAARPTIACPRPRRTSTCSDPTCVRATETAHQDVRGRRAQHPGHLRRRRRRGRAPTS